MTQHSQNRQAPVQHALPRGGAGLTVLISGAGVAGPTLAYWLARQGFRPTVVERAGGLRSSGNPVDVRGPALPVAEAMGLVPALREAATTATALSFYDRAGRCFARVPTPASRSAAGTPEVEIPRGDLARILFDAARDDTEVLMGDTITGLAQGGDGVDVTFERAAPRRFDLVVGADGLHSNVRRLAFGPDEEFVRHMGAYVATLPLPGPPDHPHDVQMHNTPGRMVAIHPGRGHAGAGFFFRHPDAHLHHRDTEGHRQLVARVYRDAGWRVPELLEHLRETPDLYFDAVCRVQMPAWSRGRVALLGDAASCLSLFGDGSSLAMAGAFTLAGALAASPGDPALAFRRYETEHRGRVLPKLRNFGWVASLLIPATRPGLAARDLAVRLLSRWSRASSTGQESPSLG